MQRDIEDAVADTGEQKPEDVERSHSIESLKAEEISDADEGARNHEKDDGDQQNAHGETIGLQSLLENYCLFQVTPR